MRLWSSRDAAQALGISVQRVRALSGAGQAQRAQGRKSLARGTSLRRPRAPSRASAIIGLRLGDSRRAQWCSTRLGPPVSPLSPKAAHAGPGMGFAILETQRGTCGGCPLACASRGSAQDPHDRSVRSNGPLRGQRGDRHRLVRRRGRRLRCSKHAFSHQAAIPACNKLRRT